MKLICYRRTRSQDNLLARRNGVLVALVDEFHPSSDQRARAWLEHDLRHWGVYDHSQIVPRHVGDVICLFRRCENVKLLGIKLHTEAE